MSAFVERVVIEVQARTEGAVSAFKTMGKSVQEAEGLGAKLKTGLSGLGNVLNAAGPGAIAGAGMAAATAVFKLADAYKDAALQADKMAKATGLSVEDASRWTEVAGDLGIDVGQVEAAMGKMNRAAAETPEKFGEAGIALQRTSDGALDVNATFLDTIQRLREIPDPAQRAALATQLLGRSGMTALAPLLDTTVNLKDALAGVSDAKVFTAEEVQKAKDFRDAMDAMQDQMDDLKLTAGSLALDYLGPLAADFATVTSELSNLVAAIPGLNGGLGDLLKWVEKTSIIGGAAELINRFRGKSDEATESSAALARQLQQSAKDAAEYTKQQELLNKAIDKQSNAVITAWEAQQRYSKAVVESALAMSDEKKTVTEKTQAIIDAAQAYVTLAQKQAEANGETLTATQTNELLKQKLDELARGAMPSVRQQVQGLTTDLGKVPKNVTSNVSVNFQSAGELEQYVRRNVLPNFGAGPAPHGASVVNVNVKGWNGNRVALGRDVTRAVRQANRYRG